jgi:recombinational DNA repair protein RecT
MLYTMFIKWWGLGLVIDGVNIVITGRAMSMVTYQGYKNKVRSVYPSAKFDVQLMREGDTFKVSKQSGKVEYSHDIADAFSEKPIIGAYCVISIDGRDYFEGLNRKDYEEMKKGSKQGYLWDKWDSEFWLKSVIKRACKRHFYDEIKEIDENDNGDYGQRDLGGSEAQSVLEEKIAGANTPEQLHTIMQTMSVADRKRSTELLAARLKELTQ